MKKVLVGLLLVAVVGMAVPNLVVAQTTPVSDCAPIKHPDRIQQLTGDSADPDNGLHCLIDTIETIGDWMFWGLLLTAFVMILYGAFLFVTAGGNTEQVGSARNTLIYALAGIALGFMARLIVRIVEQALV